MGKLVVLFLISAFLVQVLGQLAHFMRTPKEELQRDKICETEAPCGWAIYDPVTRNIIQYMKNLNCVCSEDTSCIRVDDSISIPAYIYKCRFVPENETTTTRAKGEISYDDRYLA